MTTARLIATVDPDTDDGGLLVLLPDGEIRHVDDSEAALKLVQKWGERRTRATGETTIVQLDWRRGAIPPNAELEDAPANDGGRPIGVRRAE